MHLIQKLIPFVSTALQGPLHAFPQAVKRHLVIAMAMTVCGLPLQCATLERLSLDDMIAKATAIVRGKVTTAYAASSGPVIYTHYTIQVQERLKGSGGATVDIVVPGGVANGLRQSFAGAPTFRNGEEYVFFLWTGQSGLTQVLGLTQGLFSVTQDGSPDPVSTRQASRELMLDPKTGQPVKDQTLTMHLSELRSRISSRLAGRGPVQ
jgi:hypothetical protein